MGPIGIPNSTLLPPLPQPNIPLLRKVMEWVEVEAAKPEAESLWHQGSWMERTACGTACCVAGYAVAVAGHEIGAEVVAVYEDGADLEIDGEAALWAEAGARLLGLDGETACRLFYGANTIHDVRYIARGIAARVGERL